MLEVISKNKAPKVSAFGVLFFQKYILKGTGFARFKDIECPCSCKTQHILGKNDEIKMEKERRYG